MSLLHACVCVCAFVRLCLCVPVCACVCVGCQMLGSMYICHCACVPAFVCHIYASDDPIHAVVSLHICVYVYVHVDI